MNIKILTAQKKIVTLDSTLGLENNEIQLKLPVIKTMTVNFQNTHKRASEALQY